MSLSSLLRLPTTEAIRANCGGVGSISKTEAIPQSMQELVFRSASLQTAETFVANAENYSTSPWKSVIAQLPILVHSLIVNFLRDLKRICYNRDWECVGTGEGNEYSSETKCFFFF